MKPTVHAALLAAAAALAACTGGPASSTATPARPVFTEPALFVNGAATGASGSGTRSAPFLTVQAALAAATASGGANVYVAAGHYTVDTGAGDAVVVTSGVSLLGGYAPSWTARDPAAFETVVEDVAMTAPGYGGNIAVVLGGGAALDGVTVRAAGSSGVVSSLSAAVGATHGGRAIVTRCRLYGGGRSTSRALLVGGGSSTPSSVIVTGSVIQGSPPASAAWVNFSWAIHVQPWGTLVLEDSEVDGGSGNWQAVGVRVESQDVTIRRSTIDGGAGASGADTFGVYVAEGGSAVLEGNTISGGAGSSEATAVFLLRSTGMTVQGNVLAGGGTAGPLSWSTGIALVQTSGVAVLANRVMGGRADVATGILDRGAGTLVANNLVHGGTGASSTGVDVDTVSAAWGSTAAPRVFSNTIHAGAGANPKGILYERGTVVGAASFRNNLVLCPGTGRGFIEMAATAAPADVVANDFWRCAQAYLAAGAACAGDADGDADARTCAPSEIPAGAGNLAADPALASLGGPDGDPATLADDDWALTAASPAAVRAGGTALAGVVDADFAGRPRTDPLSIGAFERD